MDSGIRAAANVWITEMRFARRAEVSPIVLSRWSMVLMVCNRVSNKLERYLPKLENHLISLGKLSKLPVRPHFRLLEILSILTRCDVATMELYWNKDVKIATNVFELGLKTFGSETEYVMQYLDFLIKSNNDSSTFLPSSHQNPP